MVGGYFATVWLLLLLFLLLLLLLKWNSTVVVRWLPSPLSLSTPHDSKFSKPAAPLDWFTHWQTGWDSKLHSVADISCWGKKCAIVTHLPCVFASVLGAVEDLNTSFSVAGERSVLILKNNYLSIHPVFFFCTISFKNRKIAQPCLCGFLSITTSIRPSMKLTRKQEGVWPPDFASISWNAPSISSGCQKIKESWNVHTTHLHNWHFDTLPVTAVVNYSPYSSCFYLFLLLLFFLSLLP